MYYYNYIIKSTFPQCIMPLLLVHIGAKGFDDCHGSKVAESVNELAKLRVVLWLLICSTQCLITADWLVWLFRLISSTEWLQLTQVVSLTQQVIFFTGL